VERTSNEKLNDLYASLTIVRVIENNHARGMMRVWVRGEVCIGFGGET
jgi:hypothetical protein